MRKERLGAILFLFWIFLLGQPLRAQYSEKEATTPPAGQKGESQEPDASQSGPKKSVGETVIVPRQQPPKPPAPQKKDETSRQEPFRFRTDVELVTVSVVVQDEKGNFLSGLAKGNFRLQEDGVPQQIQRVEASEAAMTVVLLMEFSSLYWEFLYQTVGASYGFINSLQPNDWVAVIVYDMKPTIMLDFTRNKEAAFGALNQLASPAFSEANLFDALADTLQRMEDVEGKKAIVLISSGVDTFSRMHYDQALKLVQGASTPIYAVGMGQAVRESYDARGYLGDIQRISFLQADNQLRSFARLSGGRSYFPRFEGQFPGIYGDIAATLRNEYTLAYSPTNQARDGKFRKIKLELVGPEGQPLKIRDEKGKEIKYKIQAREGYYAPRPVE
ncbi:MAG: VWA domain-containing protein [Acidobacteria bacterium]|nr:VWA domain-containing protein [Acidobacteriota bacterium]